MSFFGNLFSVNKSSENKLQKPKYIRRSNIECCEEIQKNMLEINKLYTSEFYKIISNRIHSRLEHGSHMYGSLNTEIDKVCSHTHKPNASVEFLPICNISINNERIMICEELLKYNEMGYKELSDKQAEILGMTLVVYEHFQARYLEKFDEYYFLGIRADEEYWLPIIERKIDEVYSKKNIEYNSQYKDIY